MIREKMITSSFDGAALGVSQARAPTWGHLAPGLTCPCTGLDLTWQWGWLALCPGLIGPASGPNFRGSFVRTRGYWVLGF